MSDDTMAPPPTPQPTSDAASAPEGLRDRRTVLRCAAMAALVGASAPILAACGGGDDTAGGGTSSAPATGTSSAPTTGTSSAPTSGTSSAPPSSASGGTVLGPVSDVPVGGGKIFTDAKVVVTQPAAGQFKGFSAVCTHQGNPVGSIEGGQIVCPFHGSHFSISDGSPTSGPAQRPLPAINVAVEGSNIVQSA